MQMNNNTAIYLTLLPIFVGQVQRTPGMKNVVCLKFDLLRYKSWRCLEIRTRWTEYFISNCKTTPLPNPITMSLDPSMAHWRFSVGYRRCLILDLKYLSTLDLRRDSNIFYLSYFYFKARFDWAPSPSHHIIVHIDIAAPNNSSFNAKISASINN